MGASRGDRPEPVEGQAETPAGHHPAGVSVHRHHLCYRLPRLVTPVAKMACHTAPKYPKITLLYMAYSISPWNSPLIVRQ